ncbi:hypothetical protein L2E82_36538 [Cichorium intybus]|uniref:Uncharacterized protein n=1 Tax=Cichorium intybus TaxID=13427 RepID=A0ACB9BS03_CICIN|nr:hypothetical protein L2E82_36538 [Cichorium intybus]
MISYRFLLLVVGQWNYVPKTCTDHDVSETKLTGTRVDFILLMEPMKNSREGLNGRQNYCGVIFKGINNFNMCKNHWRPLLVNEMVGRADCSVEGVTINLIMLYNQT